jgi:two-component system OmpR family response regulator
MARLLVVDDDRAILDVLTEYLASLGHEIVRASSGREAIEAARDGSIEIALVDWSMAGITGRDVVEFFRRESPRTQVLVSTGHDNEKVSDSLAGRHAREVLRKPFSLNDLADLIRQIDSEISSTAR